MKRAILLSMLSLFGVVVAVLVIIDTNRPPAVGTTGMPQFTLPFDSYVAGSGIVEGGSGNTAIGTAVSGVVKHVLVHVGEEVKAGSPLFQVDDSALQAQLLTAQARVKQARAELEKPQHELRYAENLRQNDTSAISKQRLSELRDDVAAAKAALDTVETQVVQLEKDIARCTVRAPADGRILKVNIRAGEYAEAGTLATPLMVMGDDTRVHLRVDIDESDALRVQSGAKAIAFVRGDAKQKVALRYEYTEPYVVPKTDLSGRSTERTDVRVLQVIYSFERDVLPVYIGQQMDVYIEAPDGDEAGREP